MVGCLMTIQIRLSFMICEAPDQYGIRASLRRRGAYGVNICKERTVLTTLHAGNVILTIFPNYNVSLSDNTLFTRLKVQVQITGTDQVPEAMSATLHHQIIYRLQNHSIDLPLSGCSSDSLLVVTNREEDIPSIVQIPRRITREELTQLIPLEWITNYERLHVDRRPIQSQEATFRRSIDKTVKMIFKKPDEGSTSLSPIFQTMMIQPVLKEDWCHVPAVTTEGKPIYTDKIDGHFIWDVDPTRCDPDYDCWMHDNDIDRDIILPKTTKKERCKPSPHPQRRFDPDNGPWVGIRGKKKPLSIYEEGLKILRKEGLLPPDDPTLVTWSPTGHCKSLHPQTVVQPIPCLMYSAATPEYERKFPSLERKMDPITGRTSKHFIHPSEVQPDGKLKPLTQAEEVLKWQSENMVSQNEILQSLDKMVDKISEKIDETDDNLKPKPVENSFFDPLAFPTHFKQPEMPSPFYPTYASLPSDQVRYIPTTYSQNLLELQLPRPPRQKAKLPA
ncbi:hypothetical protein KIW84_056373 [Lathyrus oleraceus]|uniref:Polyprotein n=1 Tax=Pisum sativum TaxID=3888 RepID=A0A9D4X0D8_PEA|nr:hypothetical protein KIW84_056373 [Pisum sativum]